MLSNYKNAALRVIASLHLKWWSRLKNICILPDAPTCITKCHSFFYKILKSNFLKIIFSFCFLWDMGERKLAFIWLTFVVLHTAFQFKFDFFSNFSNFINLSLQIAVLGSLVKLMIKNILEKENVSWHIKVLYISQDGCCTRFDTQWNFPLVNILIAGMLWIADKTFNPKRLIPNDNLC